MQNKNILVIGGSSGIGLALCQECIERNNVVYNISRTACPTASVQSICADVTDKRALKKAFAQIQSIDAVFYCAGISLAAPVAEVKSEDERLIDTNLVGAMECCKHAVPKMPNGGKIVLLSSLGGEVPIAYDAFYSASKAGLNMFARAFDLENKSISCTAAVLGGVRTQFSFKRKVYDGVSDEYKANFDNATDKLITIEQTGYSATYVANELIKIADRKTPPVVAVGTKTSLLLCAYKLLPQCIKQCVEKAIYGLKNI